MHVQLVCVCACDYVYGISVCGCKIKVCVCSIKVCVCVCVCNAKLDVISVCVYVVCEVNVCKVEMCVCAWMQNWGVCNAIVQCVYAIMPKRDLIKQKLNDSTRN